MQKLDISKERFLLKISVIGFLVCAILVFFAVPLLTLPGRWEEWSSDGEIGYHLVLANHLNYIFLNLFVLFMNAIFFIFMVIIIKICTTNIMTAEGSGIERSAVTKAQIAAGIFLIIETPWLGGTDYYLTFSLLMVIAIIALILYYIHWEKYRKDNLLTNILLFKDNFKKSLLILTLITGISDIIGSYFYVWYEGEWADEYYAEDSLAPFLSDFDSMIMWMRVMGIIIVAIAVFYYIIFYRSKKKNETI